VFWLEEPLPGGDLNGMRAPARPGPGSRAGRWPGPPAELSRGGWTPTRLTYYSPTWVLSTGMLRARTIAELALLRHRWFTPHTWTNGLGLLANLHVVAGVGGGPYVEFPLRPARLDRGSAATFLPHRAGPHRLRRLPGCFPTLPASAHGSTPKP